ncbi:IS3 family transposase [Gimesia maris]
MYGRYGYRSIWGILCLENWKVNHKVIERLRRSSRTMDRSLLSCR